MFRQTEDIAELLLQRKHHRVLFLLLSVLLLLDEQFFFITFCQHTVLEPIKNLCLLNHEILNAFTLITNIYCDFVA